MSLRKFFLITLTVWLCFFICTTSANSDCPEICKCYSNEKNEIVWNCSNLVSANQLWVVGATQLHGELQLSKNVKHLIIQDSKIDFPEDLQRHFPNLKTLDLSNNFINCRKQLFWLLPLSDKLIDAENIHCTFPQTFNGTQILKALQLIYDVDSRCPERCACELAHVPKDDQYVTVSVSCNNLGFTELPKILPSNVTIHMDLSNNRVSFLEPFPNNSTENLNLQPSFQD